MKIGGLLRVSPLSHNIDVHDNHVRVIENSCIMYVYM